MRRPPACRYRKRDENPGLQALYSFHDLLGDLHIAPMTSARKPPFVFSVLRDALQPAAPAMRRPEKQLARTVETAL